MNNQSSSTGVIIGVVIVLLVLIVGYLAYTQGYFEGKETETNGIQIQLGGTSETE